MDLLQLRPIIERLKARVPQLRSVGKTADLAALLEKGRIVGGPQAFVFENGAEPIEVREGSGPLRQAFLATVTVIVATDLAGPVGEAAIEELPEPISAVRFALFGWTHPAAERKFHCGASGIEDFNADTRVLLYRLDFVTQVAIQEENP